MVHGDLGQMASVICSQLVCKEKIQGGGLSYLGSVHPGKGNNMLFVKLEKMLQIAHSNPLKAALLTTLLLFLFVRV